MKKRLILPAALLCAASASAQTADAPSRARAAAAAFPAWHLDRDARTGVLSDAYGPSMALPGATPRAKADGLLRGRLTGLGIRPAEWVLTRDEGTERASFVDYKQQIDGRDVVFSHVRLRFGFNGELVRTQLAAYDAPPADLAPTRTPESLKGAAISGLDAGTRISSVVVNPDWVWYPAPAGASTVLHPAYPFETDGTEASGLPARYSGWVDALTGALLFRANEVQDGVGLTVKGTIKQQGTTYYTDTSGLPDLAVQIGTATYYTDSLGVMSAPTVNLPATVSIPLRGRWAKVNPGGVASATPVVTIPVTAAGAVYQYPDSSRWVNAYYHASRMHGFMKRLMPAFTGLDNTPMALNIDLTSGTCNAFYSNTSLNFYAAGGGCPSYADAASVIYHEYGHAIAEKYYGSRNAGRMYNGALNEGYADVWAMCITRSGIVGPANSIIRRYDQGAKAFPADVVGEVHADGEMIAGAWWDVAVNTGSVDTMIKLFVGSYQDLNDGPAGAENALYKRILVSALLADDNDNNLNNGTPHFAAIINAFARHGIYYGSGASVAHTELAHQNAGEAIAVKATVTTSAPALVGNMTLFYKLQDTVITRSYDSVRMTDQGGGLYQAMIPAQQTGALLTYYITLDNALAPADRAVFPEGFRPNLQSLQATLPYQFGVGLSKRVVVDFETPVSSSWVLGTYTGDNLTSTMTGRWVQAKPVATYQTFGSISLISQTGADHTTGSGMCLVTGNGSTALDGAQVSNGKTTVVTGAFDLNSFTDPVVEYYRWFGNDRSTASTGSSLVRDDIWSVQLRDTTSIYWQPVEYTKQADYQWRRRIVRVSDFFKADPSAGKIIQLRFNAQNTGQLGIVEAAIDDIVIYDRHDPLAVETATAQRAAIYPNPANTTVTVQLATAPASGSIRLSDATGRTVSNTALNAGQLTYTVPTVSLVPGLYFVTVTVGSFIQSHQVVVAH